MVVCPLLNTQKKPPKRGFLSYIKHKLIYGYFLIL
nr:MAG TPA: hypothetical protein [Bacteriophage sp.]